LTISKNLWDIHEIKDDNFEDDLVRLESDIESDIISYGESPKGEKLNTLSSFLPGRDNAKFTYDNNINKLVTNNLRTFDLRRRR
jgi:hypothetical protein